MRILIHDFGGYPFPAELSRELAARGHHVGHSWCSSLVDTPASAHALGSGQAGSGTLELLPVDLGEPLEKYRLVKRLRHERRYGALAAALTLRFLPDVVLAANVPLDAQRRLLGACRGAGIAFVFWVQDLIGPGTHDLLKRRLPVVGNLIGRHYMRVEARLLRASDALVPIAEDFRAYLGRCGVEERFVTTIENWAPLSELTVRAKSNDWSVAEGLDRMFVFAYTGALGMKQDPELIIVLAQHYRDRDDVRVVVHTGEPGLGYLQERGRRLGLGNLLVRPFVAWDRVPDVLGAADVLLATLHGDAGRYSVPSKVLTYLCARRPLLISVPADNLASRVVAEHQAGIVVEPGDPRAFLDAARRLHASSHERERLGANARRYAETHFAIEPIADRFDRVLRDALSHSGFQCDGCGTRATG